jgi:hypothetical protein
MSRYVALDLSLALEMYPLVEFKKSKDVTFFHHIKSSFHVFVYSCTRRLVTSNVLGNRVSDVTSLLGTI